MSNLQTGTVVGKYVLLEHIGRGSMGEVWLAQHTTLANQKVAIKFLLSEHQLLNESVARFLREAEVLDALGKHANIVGISDIAKLGERDYLVMEYVSQSLADFLGETRADDGHTRPATPQKSRKMDIDEALNIGTQICEGLIFAHQNGVIHRDLKPSNVLLDEYGVVKLCDFGIAHITNGPGLTQTGMSMGTIGYTAPDILSGQAKEADERSDVYSVGAILYHLTTGTMPIGRFDDPARLNKDIPSWLNTCILKCLQNDPSLRYATAGDLLKDLTPPVPEPEPPPPPPPEKKIPSVTPYYDAIGFKETLLLCLESVVWGGVIGGIIGSVIWKLSMAVFGTSGGLLFAIAIVLLQTLLFFRFLEWRGNVWNHKYDDYYVPIESFWQVAVGVVAGFLFNKVYWSLYGLDLTGHALMGILLGLVIRIVIWGANYEKNKTSVFHSVGFSAFAGLLVGLVVALVGFSSDAWFYGGIYGAMMNSVLAAHMCDRRFY